MFTGEVATRAMYSYITLFYIFFLFVHEYLSLACSDHKCVTIIFLCNACYMGYLLPASWIPVASTYLSQFSAEHTVYVHLAYHQKKHFRKEYLVIIKINKFFWRTVSNKSTYSVSSKQPTITISNSTQTLHCFIRITFYFYVVGEVYVIAFAHSPFPDSAVNANMLMVSLKLK